MRLGCLQATRSRARMHPRVEPCSPDPKARPASRVRVSRPADGGMQRWVPRTGEASADELLGKRSVGSSQPALRLGRSSPHRRLDAGQFCRQRKCGHERRLVVTDRLHTFDAPGTRLVIAEETDRGTGARQRGFVDVERCFRHVDRHGFEGCDTAPKKVPLASPRARGQRDLSAHATCFHCLGSRKSGSTQQRNRRELPHTFSTNRSSTRFSPALSNATSSRSSSAALTVP